MTRPLKLDHRIHVVQGEYYVTSSPAVMLTTTLGSCIAACIYDPFVGVGGMNHFLLPHGDAGEGAAATRYGAYAMERLVNDVLKAGGQRERLEAKLFGGGRLTDSRLDVGRKNAEFASEFLEREGVREAPGSLGGDYARRIQFWPATGRIRQMALARRAEAVPIDLKRARAHDTSGSLELF